MKGSVSDTLIHIKVSETAMNNAVFEAAETVETWQWKVLSYAPLAAHPLQGTCPRARWVSMLLLEWLRQQCDHRLKDGLCGVRPTVSVFMAPIQ